MRWEGRLEWRGLGKDEWRVVNPQILQNVWKLLAGRGTLTFWIDYAPCNVCLPLGMSCCFIRRHSNFG